MEVKKLPQPTEETIQTFNGVPFSGISRTRLIIREQTALFFGIVILILTSPVLLMAGVGTLWELIDRKFKFKDPPGTGMLFKLGAFINRKTQKFNERFVSHKEDAYMINVIILLAVVIPIMFLGCLKYTFAYGFSWSLCFVYNVLRIGPFLMNFAYAYALSHKEGHMGRHLYKEPYGMVLGYSFNWFIGLFYGILPSTFAIGHSINHHKYNNNEEDVLSTFDRPRDSFGNWVRYLPRFALYATNISTVAQFYKEGKYKLTATMVFASLYYVVFCVYCYSIHPLFAFGYVIYPFFENVILLAAINWSWHAFVDPEDIDNEYAYSITLIHGTFNVLEEDYHVVHHQYPGAHWTQHPDLYEKHKEEYDIHHSSMFKETHAFEMFGFVAFSAYNILADKFISKEKLTNEQKIALIKTRTRGCTWGPFQNCYRKEKKA